MPLFGPPDIEKLKTKSNVRGLIRALRYVKDPAVRRDAIHALVETGHASEAVDALETSGDVQAVELLIAVLGMPDTDARRVAASALGQVGGVQATEGLRAALSDGDSHVRQAAAEALGKLGWQPDGSEAGAVYWVVQRRWDRCVEIGEPAVGPLIAPLVEESGRFSNLVRSSAADALGRIGSKKAVGPLIAALKSRSDSVAGAAASALGEFGARRATRSLFWGATGRPTYCPTARCCGPQEAGRPAGGAAPRGRPPG
jgi:HEAT repeat protein